jgi:osmoprotectant transport system ATP-binding protein
MNPVELRRSIGYVIQQIGLMPHMTIRENNVVVVHPTVQTDNDLSNPQVNRLI